MKPPPPRLPAAGCVTARAKPTATAASTALPPRFKTSTPTRVACSSADPTMPRRARTGSREAPPGCATATVATNASKVNRKQLVRAVM